MSKSSSDVAYEVIVQEDPDTGDMLLPIPQELLDQLGWKEGDELEFNEASDGSIILSKR